MPPLFRAVAFLGAAAACAQQSAAVRAARFPSNPILTVEASPSLEGNVNGPALIRVPEWVKNPLGRYYLYFAHHRGHYIRLAYANALEGPWKIYEPGVLHARDTAMWRAQPDPSPSPYTHIASPEVTIDAPQQRLVMHYHGHWTNGRPFPPGGEAALRDAGFGQFTQAAVSPDGLHFTAQPGITRESYLRVFPWAGQWFGLARLGVLLRSPDLLSPFSAGHHPFDGGPYARRVRHVALLRRNATLYVFSSAIGDAPERLLVSTMPLGSDWTAWKASEPVTILAPEAAYECADLPNVPSLAGDISGRARQLRDPAIFEEAGRVYLVYSICGEQGLAAAELFFR